ncbi:MAG: histidine kinase [Burkholderiaceae bacterium]|nr:histidine kinase [Rhodoferax sp.]MCP5283659.1 histidine kinase [Burkholderiaceae bacterium]
MAAITRETVSLAWKSWFGNDLEPHGPWWLQWVLTGVFCAVIAGCFTVLSFALNALDGGRGWMQPGRWALWYGKNLMVSLVIGFLIHTMFTLLIPAIGKARIRGWSDARRSIFFAAVPITGVVIGWPIGVSLAAGGMPGWMENMNASMMVGVVLFSALISFIFFQIFSAKQRQVVAERRAVEAQLRLLQAQMEPHFLFNTLAGVQTLIDAEPARAKRMLETFTDYLRATVASLRTEDSTVGHELALAEAYLGLMQQRMEDRLRFELTVDDSLRTQAMPPLLLQPLVENAIHHGLEPKLDGGTVRITVSRQGANLCIDVADDGLGVDAPRRRSTGNGVALANVRQRLAGRWGTQASLTLAPASPGTRAMLRLPLNTTNPA